MRLRLFTIALFALSSSCRRPTAPAVVDAGPPGPQLVTLGPRLVSNQTSQPLSVTGDHLRAGLSLRLGAPVNQSFPLTVLDEKHAFLRLPAHLDVGTQPDVRVEATLSEGTGQAQLTFANDTTFPDLVAFARSAKDELVFAASQTEDVVYALNVASKDVTRLPVGDGPTALATYLDPAGREWLVVAHAFADELRLLSVDGPAAATRTLPGPRLASGVVVSDGVAFVAEQARDTVVAIELGEGKERWRTPVAPNPRELTIAGSELVVGSLQSGLIEVLDAKSGAPRVALQPQPGVHIVGGATEKYGDVVMGGKAVRDLAWSSRTKRLFVSSIGPNVGPNADRMEVSMNGGVGVVDLSQGWQRHLGFGAGVTEALALDDQAGLLYATDVGLGLVRVLNVKKLAASDGGARTALLQEVALPVASGFPLVRPAADFTVKGRAGPSLHSGPKAAVLSANRRTLYVLNRFTGTVAFLDVTGAAKKQVTFVTQVPLTPMLGQRTRRQGQVLYFADLGRSAMTCDACHFEGHTEGIFFEKTTPMRIYRSSTVRGARETPPYFTPASTQSLGQTADFVGGRNRYHNPDPTPQEVDALALFTSLIPTLPNPFVGEDGAPVERLTLPDGQEGHPREGLRLFEGRAGCADCHPAPHFTTDQDPATRGRYLDVGTPHVLPLREELQNPLFHGFAPPSLVGAWDIFPMLTTGSAGLAVRPDGSVGIDTRFPLRVAVERWAPKHGRADRLSEPERNDLLAYVLSL